MHLFKSLYGDHWCICPYMGMPNREWVEQSGSRMVGGAGLEVRANCRSKLLRLVPRKRRHDDVMMTSSGDVHCSQDFHSATAPQKYGLVTTHHFLQF